MMTWLICTIHAALPAHFTGSANVGRSPVAVFLVLKLALDVPLGVRGVFVVAAKPRSISMADRHAFSDGPRALSGVVCDKCVHKYSGFLRGPNSERALEIESGR